MNYGGGSPSMVVDGSGGWRLCLATAGVSNDLAPFIEVVAFDLRKAPAHGTGGRHFAWNRLSGRG